MGWCRGAMNGVSGDCVAGMSRAWACSLRSCSTSGVCDLSLLTMVTVRMRERSMVTGDSWSLSRLSLTTDQHDAAADCLN